MEQQSMICLDLVFLFYRKMFLSLFFLKLLLNLQLEDVQFAGGEVFCGLCRHIYAQDSAETRGDLCYEVC